MKSGISWLWRKMVTRANILNNTDPALKKEFTCLNFLGIFLSKSPSLVSPPGAAPSFSLLNVLPFFFFFVSPCISSVCPLPSPLSFYLCVFPVSLSVSLSLRVCTGASAPGLGVGPTFSPRPALPTRTSSSCLTKNPILKPS